MRESKKQEAINLFVNQNLKKAEIARRLGVPDSTVRRWLIDVDVTAATDTSDAPLSDTIIPKLHTCTRSEAIDDLTRIAKANPEMVITRNYYRVHGKYAESAWSSHFGTFLEFKRQANIIPTRQQHAIERQIAKHASVDHYREMSIERMSYADKYIVENSNRYKKVIIVGDLHDKNVDPFYMQVLLDTCKRVQPDIIVFNGDIFDLPEFGKYTVDPRDWDVVSRIKYVHENIFAPIRAACPTAQLDFIEGNHEARLLRHLADTTPALRAVLSDLHGMTVSSLLGLDRFRINYIAKGDLAAYTIKEQQEEVAKNYKVYFNSFIVSHENNAKLGFPGINGHHHKTEVESHFNHHFGAYQWIQHGCGHKLDAEYCHAKWNLGFVIAVCNTETRQTVFEPVTFTPNMAVVGGKVYTRN